MGWDLQNCLMLDVRARDLLQETAPFLACAYKQPFALHHGMSVSPRTFVNSMQKYDSTLWTAHADAKMRHIDLRVSIHSMVLSEKRLPCGLNLWCNRSFVPLYGGTG